jgi:hypothetical protein
MTDDRLKTESAGRPWLKLKLEGSREVARRAVRRCAGCITDSAHYRRCFGQPTFATCSSRHKLPTPLRTSRF